MRISSTRRISWWWLLPLAVLLLAWWIFITHLGLESMWYDEGISWRLAATSPTFGDLLAQWPLGTGHPIGNFLWLWLWIKLTASQNLFVMRLTASIPMLLAVAFTYRLGLVWFRSRWAALGAMAFLATSGLVIYYARELRMYALVVLLTVISWYLLTRFLEGHKRSLWLYGLAVAAMAYTHYLTAFIVAAQIIVVLIFYRRQLLRLIPAYLLSAVLIAPWLPVFLRQVYDASRRSGHNGTLALGQIGQFDGNEPTTFHTIEQFFQQYSAGQFAFVGLLLLLGIVLGLGMARASRFRRYTGMALLWALLVLGMVFAVNLVVPVYNPRYVLPVLPALALLVGVAAALIPARARPVLIAVVLVGGVAAHTSAFLDPKTPHGELLGVVEARRLPGDRIWYNLTVGAMGSYVQEELDYYIDVVYPDLQKSLFIWDAPEDFADPAVNRVWDIRPYWNTMPAQAAAVLKATRSVSEKYDFGSYEVRLYEAPPSGQTPATFADTFSLLVGSLDTSVYHAGDSILTRLWWRSLKLPPLDYSYGLYLRDSSQKVVAQADSGLTLGDADTPTSQWLPSDRYALATPTLALPAALPPGNYSLWLGVYYWEHPDPLPIVADVGRVDPGTPVLRLANITVK